MIIPPIRYHINPKEHPYLGILYVASFLRQKGYNINLSDLRDKSLDKSINLIKQSDVYCFTSSFLDLFTCHELARLIRKKYPKSKILIGGTGPTASPEYIDPKVFDSFIIGEGEFAVLEFLEDVGNNKKILSKTPHE